MYKKLKEECLRENLRLPELGLVLFTFGNVSCFDRARGVMAIKPSGVDYARMRVDDIVVLDVASGKVLEGRLRPSSDTPTHLELYRAYPELGGVVHTHSPEAVAWAQAGRSIPVYGTTHADHWAGDIPCTPCLTEEQIRGDYEAETGKAIVAEFARLELKPAEVGMVLVAGHGPFTWGKNAAEAVYRARVLEEVAKMARFTEAVRPGAPRLAEALIRKHYERKHGAGAYSGQKSGADK